LYAADLIRTIFAYSVAGSITVGPECAQLARV
jgi:hypothetical protein